MRENPPSATDQRSPIDSSPHASSLRDAGLANSSDPSDPHAPTFVPVIPAGGGGRRLWPLSRPDRPKFLLDLTASGQSLLQQTVARLAPLADRPPVVMTGTAHRSAVREQLAGTPVQILTEPSGRNTMPAIALAAAVAHRDDPEAVIGSFPADHVITDELAFQQAVRQAVHAAADGSLVTIGVRPSYPATGFGYIHAHNAAPVDSPHAIPVTEFVEKPSLERAREFLATGDYWWNAGIFVAQTKALLAALDHHEPELARGVRQIAAAYGTSQEHDVISAVWPTVPAIAIDYALAEPLAAAGRMLMVPGEFGWDDVGDFAALGRVLRSRLGERDNVSERDEVSEGDDLTERDDPRGCSQREGNARLIDGTVVLADALVQARDSHATVISTSDRPIVTIGLEGITVVDTPDAVLVVANEHAQSVSPITESTPER